MRTPFHRSRRVGWLWRRRRGSALDAAASAATRHLSGEMLVANAGSVFTTAEEAELALAHTGQRAVEAEHNRKQKKMIAALAKRAPGVVAARVAVAMRKEAVAAARASLEAFQAAVTSAQLAARHMGRWARAIAIGVLSLVDVAAYRVAVEIAFDLDDSVFGIIESVLLALLSLGMVVAAAVSSGLLKALHEASDDLRPAALRRWRQVGIPALVAAVALVLAGAAFRLTLLADLELGWYMYLAVPVFTAAAVVGAFLIEYVWANPVLDELDGHERKLRSAQRADRRTGRRVSRLDSRYLRLEHLILTTWSTYAPDHTAQVELAAAEIAGARSRHPELFHPLGTSVIDSAHEVAGRGTTVLDAGRHLTEHGLRHHQLVGPLTAVADEGAPARPDEVGR